MEQDYAAAMKWYGKSADQGYSYAQYYLGNCYYYGWGTEQDYAEAVKWYQKSADQDNSYGQYMLGECYYNGNGVTQDYESAVKWYQHRPSRTILMDRWGLELVISLGWDGSEF